MSADAPSIDWLSMLNDCRAFLDAAPGEPVPVEELREQAKSHGYSASEVKASLAASDAVEAVGDDPLDPLVAEAVAEDDTPTEADLAENGESVEERALRAFDVAIDYYVSKLDEPLDYADAPAETPREFYTGSRGWDGETVESKRLGYAPASGDGLLNRLMREGFERDAIVGTGLFDDRLRPTFTGRFVLPYFDADGRAVYAIGRDALNPDDYHSEASDSDAAAKYQKVSLSGTVESIREPIYGVDTLSDGDDVVITEGIADAISAHMAGFTALSPVTTTFKHSDRERLAELLDDHDVERVFVANDAEPAESSVSEDGDLYLPWGGEGLRGALTTAEFLADEGYDARVVDLPTVATEKLDLDDYLTEWGGDLGVLLRAAKPLTEHPAYDAERVAVSAARSSRPDESFERDSDHDGGSSALFDLTMRDVTGLSPGYRGTNPLGHHGDSENYYVLSESTGLGYDHKHKTAYNALTHLLVAAGERPADAPNGALDDREVFEAWREAKESGALPDDDPVPRRALVHVAVDGGACARGEVEDGWKLPADAYNAALDVIEDLGLDPGRPSLTGGSGVESAIPVNHIEALHESHADLDAVSTSELREKIEGMVLSNMASKGQMLLDVPTAAGKSYTSASQGYLALGETDGKPVVHLHATKDARHEAKLVSDDAGVSSVEIEGRSKCPVAAGDYDPGEDGDGLTYNGKPISEFIREKCDGQNVPFSSVHRHLNEVLDLPCCVEDDGADCPYRLQWDGVPRDGDGEPTVDVVHATHVIGHVPSVRSHSHVIVDELPSYNVDLDDDTFRAAVTAFLKEIRREDDPAFLPTSYGGLAHLARNGFTSNDADGGDSAREKYDVMRAYLARKPGIKWYIENPDAHGLARGLAGAVWASRFADADSNGRVVGRAVHEPPRPDSNAREDEGWNLSHITVVLDEYDAPLLALNVPHFGDAESLTCLDAHPSRLLWGLQTGTFDGEEREFALDYKRPLAPAQRRRWRRGERGLTVVQIGDAIRPLAVDDDGVFDSRFNNGGALAALIDQLRSSFGERFRTMLTTKKADEPTLTLMQEAGIGDAEIITYGKERSNNDFAGERVGFLNGCMDPGDDYVYDLAAALGLDVVAETTTGSDGAEVRATGRGFEGDDGGFGSELLATVREQHVAQGVGRYAREPDDPDDEAIVFVRTGAVPPSLVDYRVEGVVWGATKRQRAALDALLELDGEGEFGGATRTEVAERAGMSKNYAGKCLNYLIEQNVVEKLREGSGPIPDLYGPTEGVDGDEAAWVLRVEEVEPVDEAEPRFSERAQSGLGEFVEVLGD